MRLIRLWQSWNFNLKHRTHLDYLGPKVEQ